MCAVCTVCTMCAVCTVCTMCAVCTVCTVCAVCTVCYMGTVCKLWILCVFLPNACIDYVKSVHCVHCAPQCTIAYHPYITYVRKE